MSQSIPTLRVQMLTGPQNTVCFMDLLPTELLCEIFHASLPHSRRVYFQETIVTAPWKLGVVCRRWRESALGDPTLWSSIEIKCGFLSSSQIAKYYPLAALQTQIFRSGDAPLELTFRTGYYDEQISSHFLALLEAVVGESHRWKTLNLNWGIEHPAAILIFAQIQGRLPQLHRLEINWDFLPIAIFEVAPQLRQVFSLHYEAQPLSVPWPQITHFEGESSARVCLDICTQAALLVECAFTISHANMTPTDMPMVLLPQLRRLAISGSGILPLLEAPNLEYLFLDTLASAAPFLLRSQCRLKGLDVSSCPSPDLIHLVPHIPTLLHFHAYFPKASEVPHHTAKLFRVLRDACPNLVSIHVTFSQVLCPYDALYDLCVARRRTLTFACIRECDDYIPPAVKQRFAALRSSSLEVILDDNESTGVAWMRKSTEDMRRPGS
ncbi:hypothetical protein C8R46DRAFT_239174 [Mycena filopes]|nr:hypothetical protein C8R46DRAFT_239174 [Mycena filopes]